MTNLGRKPKTLAKRRERREEAEELAGREGGKSTSAVERVAAYSAMENEPIPVEDSGGVPAEPAGEELDLEVELPADLAGIGEELGTVMKSAQEAAARIRRAAHEEAERLRSEAESAAAAQLEEARRIASADLAAGSHIRAEGEAYAGDARAAADAFAEGRRREAEQAAAQIVSDAQKVLAAADAEVEHKIREADEKARERRQTVQLEAERYEKRLEKILFVFRGMNSQLEDLLGRQAESSNLAEASGEALEDALRPDSPSSRVG